MKNRIRTLVDDVKDTRSALDNYNQTQPPVVYLNDEHEELFTVGSGGQETVDITLETDDLHKFVSAPGWNLFFDQQSSDDYKYPDGSNAPDINSFHVWWYWHYLGEPNDRNQMRFRMVCVNNTGASQDLRLVIRFTSIGYDAPTIT